MATKQRTIGHIENSYYQIRIFHFIDHTTDITEISCEILGDPELIWESQLSGGAIIFASALSAKISLQLTGTLDIFNMQILRNECYDGTYSRVSGKKLLYCYIYDKVQAEYYYLSLSDNMFAKSIESINEDVVTLTFTDGLERAKHFTRLIPDITDLTGDTQIDNPDWTAAFVDANYYSMATIFQKCLEGYSADSDLRTWSFGIEDHHPLGTSPSHGYPLLFSTSALPSIIEFHNLHMKGSDINYGTTASTIIFSDAFDVVKYICKDLFMILVSYGIGKFKLVPRFHLSLPGSGSTASGVVLTPNQFKKPIRITFQNQVYLGIISTFNDSGTIHKRFMGKSGFDEYLKDKVFNETCKVSTGNSGSGGPAITGNLYDNLSPKNKIQSSSIGGVNPPYLQGVSCSFWDVTNHQYRSFMDNTVDYDTDGFSGLTIAGTKPTHDSVIIEFGQRYQMNYKSVDYRMFVKKLTRRLKSFVDDVEFLTVKSINLDDI